jgi:hypothetical protein
MSKSYIILYAYDNNKIDRKELVNRLETNGISEYWEFCLPYSVFIKSSKSSQEISQFIEKEFGAINHLVVEVQGNYHGRLPSDYWDIFSKS